MQVKNQHEMHLKKFREDAQSQLQQLKDQEQLDVERFKSDTNILQRELDSVAKLFNFLATKGQKRATSQLEAQEALRASK
jgi:hypothetical protein